MKRLFVISVGLFLLFGPRAVFGQDKKTSPPATEAKKKSGPLCMKNCGSTSKKSYDVSNEVHSGEIIRGPRVVVAYNLKSPARYTYEWNSKTSYSAPPDLWSKLIGAAAPAAAAKQPAAPTPESPTPAKELAMMAQVAQPGGAKAVVKKGQPAISSDSLAVVQKAQKAIAESAQPIEDANNQIAGIDQNLQDSVSSDLQAATTQAANTSKAADAVSTAGLALVNFLSAVDAASTSGQIDNQLAPDSNFMKGVNAQWADWDVLTSLQNSTDLRKAFLSSRKTTFDKNQVALSTALSVSMHDLVAADEDLSVQSYKLLASPRSDAEKELIESTSADVEKVLAEVRGANTNLANASDTLDWATSTNNAIETALSNMVSSSATYKDFQKAQAALVAWRVTLVDTKNELTAYSQDKLHNPDPFSTSFDAGCDYTFSTTKQTTLTLTVIDNLPDKSATAPSNVLSLTVECASPFNVSAGVEFSTISSRQFAIQPVATPPGSTTTTNQFVLTSDSSFHPLPLVMVSARLCEPNEKIALNMSFGISGNFSSQNGSSAEFLIGPSLSLFRTMYFTPGLHIGKKTNLGSGFSIGNPVPPNVTTTPLESSYAVGFGFAITFTKP